MNEYPSREEFQTEVDGYYRNLTKKRRAKALMTQKLYDDVLHVLVNPNDTSFKTAQFRHWAKRYFILEHVLLNLEPPKRKQDYVIRHLGKRGEQKRVSVDQEIYNIILNAHLEANHGGRDKSVSLVKKLYYGIPKILIDRFVKVCPVCRNKNGRQGRYRMRQNQPPTLPSLCNQVPLLPPNPPLRTLNFEPSMSSSNPGYPPAQCDGISPNQIYPCMWDQQSFDGAPIHYHSQHIQHVPSTFPNTQFLHAPPMQQNKFSPLQVHQMPQKLIHLQPTLYPPQMPQTVAPMFMHQ